MQNEFINVIYFGWLFVSAFVGRGICISLENLNASTARDGFHLFKSGSWRWPRLV
jgi:hypothetical protein